MHRSIFIFGLLAVAATTPVIAKDCVKVRNGKGGHDCMKFTPKEQQVAAKYGVRLGVSYEDVKRQLTKNGWSVDKDWLSENAAGTKGKVLPVCGNGQDAVCSITFAKGKSQIDLVLSGTNDGLPLISLEEQP